MSDILKNAKLETLCLHAGQEPDPTTNSRAVPIYRTASYVFNNTEHAANLFALKELGNIYTRLMNPTNDVLEQRMAQLDGGGAALALASGTSAIHYAIINICQQGDEIVAANNLYGGTYTMFDAIHPQFGITTKFVDPIDPENFAKAITPKTRMIFCETIGNPGLDVADLEAIGEIAKAHGLPLVVDGTFTTPALLKPLEHGANITCYSMTKWLGGHGTGIGGVCVDGANFSWGNEKFPLYNEPEPSYHGLRFGHDLPDFLAPVAFILRMRTIPLRNLGACMSPDNAWMFLQGVETLSLRMARHSENAMAAAKYLQDHPKVEWVTYPGLENHRSHDVAKKYLKSGFGGMVSFGIKGGIESGQKFIDSLQLFSHLANVGDAKSLAIHPASTTHSQLSEEQLTEAGITPDMVRLSVGLEHIDDIKADLDQALAAS